MNLYKICAAATLAFGATVALAQEAPPIQLTLTEVGPGAIGTTFQRAVSGLFVDTFSFAPASVEGSVSVSFISGAGPISFFAALLNDQGFSYVPESGQNAFTFQSTVAADAPLSLTVLGFAGDAETLTAGAGTYAGSIQVQTVAAIPEPETYALMLLGLAAVGSIARRRP